MKLTALEIRKHEFSRAFRGYDSEEVDAFLNMVAQHWQSMSEEMRRMEDRLEEQIQRVNHYLKVEEALEAALDNAKTISQEKLNAAEASAEETVKEAQEKADKAVSEAKAEASDTLSDAEARASEKLSSAEARAKKTVADAEARARQTLGDAEARAQEALSSARSRAEKTLAKARQELGALMDAADEARKVARAELARVEAERQRIAMGFSDFLSQAMGAIEGYSQAEPPPELDAFQDMGSLVPLDMLDHNPADYEITLDPESETGLEALRPPEPLGPSEPVSEIDLVARQLADDDDDVAEPPAAGPEDELDMEPEPVMTVPGGASDDSEPDPDRFPTDLPSAEDGFEEEGVGSAKDEKAPFGAEDEIKKIRRILEDLDN